MYYTGRGTKLDKQKHYIGLKNQQQLYNPIAQTNLAMMYLTADGVTKDINKTILLLTKSAEQNNLSKWLN